MSDSRAQLRHTGRTAVITTALGLTKAAFSAAGPAMAKAGYVQGQPNKPQTQSKAEHSSCSVHHRVCAAKVDFHKVTPTKVQQPNAQPPKVSHHKVCPPTVVTPPTVVSATTLEVSIGEMS